MDGYDGVMVTEYYEVEYGRTLTIKQTMRLRASSEGLLILGYNPVFYGTNRRVSTYSPDNFLFQIRPDGSYQFTMCDDRERCSKYFFFFLTLNS